MKIVITLTTDDDEQVLSSTALQNTDLREGTRLVLEAREFIKDLSTK